MTEFSSCLSSLVFGRTRAGGSFLFQESLKSKEHSLLAIDMESYGVALAASMRSTYSHPITHLVANQRGA